MSTACEPQRPADPAGDVQDVGLAVVHPGGRHGADQLLERRATRAELVDEREDRLGVDRHLRLLARDVVPREQVVVVDDDPVVHARDPAVAHRMVVGGNGGVALRVVADVHQHLRRVRGDDDRVEELAGARLLLVHLERGAGAVRVADRIGAPLGNPREQCLGSKRPAHARAGSEAVARDAAHVRSPFAPLAPLERP